MAGDQNSFRDIDWPAAVLVLATGAVGGSVAAWLGAPLPWMLGSLLSVAMLALSGSKPFGIEPQYPIWTRNFFVPIIGLSIGSAFTPEILTQALRWWPSLLALVLYVPIANFIGYLIARNVGGLDRTTALYGSTPGGFIEALTLGEEDGADPAMLAMLQFMRLSLIIILVPAAFSILLGEVVGSAAGVVIGAGRLTALEWFMMAAAGALGFLGGRAINLPAAVITGPILLSGALHLLGWVDGAVPGWLVAIVQLVIGVTLGIRFLGRNPSLLLKAGKIAVITAAAVLALAGIMTLILTPVLGERWEAVYLAFAPGGLPEMTLIAVSLETSVVFVSAHHVIRIVIAVYSMRLLRRWVLRP